MLNHALVFACGFNSDASFMNIMAHGFFNINILARLTRPNGHEAMPVIGGCDGNSVHIFISKCFADILNSFGSLACFAFNILDPFGKSPFIRINQVSDLDPFLRNIPTNMGRASAIQSCNRNTNSIICAQHLARRFCTCNRNGCSNCKCSFAKLSAI